MEVTVYHISLKSHCGEMLFQGPSNNMMVARFEGCIYRDPHAHSFNNEPICMHT